MLLSTNGLQQTGRALIFTSTLVVGGTTFSSGRTTTTCMLSDRTKHQHSRVNHDQGHPQQQREHIKLIENALSLAATWNITKKFQMRERESCSSVVVNGYTA